MRDVIIFKTFKGNPPSDSSSEKVTQQPSDLPWEPPQGQSVFSLGQGRSSIPVTPPLQSGQGGSVFPWGHQQGGTLIQATPPVGNVSNLSRESIPPAIDGKTLNFDESGEKKGDEEEEDMKEKKKRHGKEKEEKYDKRN